MFSYAILFLFFLGFPPGKINKKEKAWEPILKLIPYFQAFALPIKQG